MLTTKYPRKTLVVVLQCIHDDGGLLAAMVNAACAAMMDAGVEMNYLPLGSTYAVSPTTGLIGDVKLFHPISLPPSQARVPCPT